MMAVGGGTVAAHALGPALGWVRGSRSNRAAAGGGRSSSARPPEPAAHRSTQESTGACLLLTCFIFPKFDILKNFRGHIGVLKHTFSSGSRPFAGEVLVNIKGPRHSLRVQWLNYCSEGKGR